MHRVKLIAAISLVAALALAARNARASGEHSYISDLPQVLSRTEPEYPADRRVEGTVLVRAHVDTTGHVIEATILKSIPMLDEAALACVRQWTFRPGESNGTPIDMWVAIPIVFSPHDDERSSSAAPEHSHGYTPRSTVARGNMPGASRYFVNADTTDLVIITLLRDDHVQVESPGRWTGVGVLHGATYWGVFLYGDDAKESRNRGARGTHLGTLEPSGRWRIRTTFTNRQWPSVLATWTPRDPARK